MKTHNQTHWGTAGWFGLAVYCAAWDYVAEETLTHAWQRGMEKFPWNFMLAGALGATALHLAGILPRKADPYCAFGTLDKKA